MGRKVRRPPPPVAAGVGNCWLGDHFFVVCFFFDLLGCFVDLEESSTGIIGAFLGGWLLSVLGVSIGGGLIGSIISALVGAIVLIFGLGLIKR